MQLQYIRFPASSQPEIVLAAMLCIALAEAVGAAKPGACSCMCCRHAGTPDGTPRFLSA